jgi:hypothetical protein
MREQTQKPYLRLEEAVGIIDNVDSWEDKPRAKFGGLLGGSRYSVFLPGGRTNFRGLDFYVQADIETINRKNEPTGEHVSIFYLNKEDIFSGDEGKMLYHYIKCASTIQNRKKQEDEKRKTEQKLKEFRKCSWEIK